MELDKNRPRTPRIASRALKTPALLGVISEELTEALANSGDVALLKVLYLVSLATDEMEAIEI